MISLQDYITSSGKYPERAKSTELTEQVKLNAVKLLDAVNKLLVELGIDKATVSSGFRPSSVNSTIPNAAKKSLHMTGLAIDISDVDGKLDSMIQSKPELLKKYNLWLERPDSTPKWTHLDLGNRSDRPVRVFRP